MASELTSAPFFVQKFVYKAIIERLQQQGVSTHILDGFISALCLPWNVCTPADWDSLPENPLQVTDADLEEMFVLYRSTRFGPQYGQNETIYYVHSFMYKVEEFEAVFDTSTVMY